MSEGSCEQGGFPSHPWAASGAKGDRAQDLDGDGIIDDLDGDGIIDDPTYFGVEDLDPPLHCKCVLASDACFAGE